MALIVQKFGGSSVGDAERIRNVARRLIAAKERGDEVVAVVSAMGDVTDDLLDLARQVSADPPEREMDMLLATGEQVTIALLAMAIHSLGHNAVSLTGPQAGIVSDTTHTKARIQEVRADRVREALDEGFIVIVAGFQGISDEGEITTLGRGGSDTTAVAIAAGVNADACEIYTDVDGVYTADPRIVPAARKLDAVSDEGEITTLGRGGSDTTAVAIAAGVKADACEIYTDVDGVYTADPRIVPAARKLDAVSYEEMLEMAATGARVLQLRSVEFARNHGVVLVVRSSFNDNPGTVVKEAEAGMENAIISGVTHDTSEAKVTIRDVPDRPGVAAEVFSRLAEHNVNVDMIIQNVSEDGLTDISFTTPEEDLIRAKRAVEDVVAHLEARTWSVDTSVAKVSLVGAGMKTHPGVAANMFRALADAGVNLDMISTSSIRISCVIDASDVEKAVRALHTHFGLDQAAVTAEVSPGCGGGE
jgi:aspartate kinase